MSRSIVFTALAATLLASAAVLAQAPAGAPAGATGTCKDGSYATTATKKGACRGHKGVQDWYAAAAATAEAAPAPAATGSKKKHGGSKSAAAEAAPAGAATPAPAASATAAAPAAGASGQCKDGTYSTATSKKGACRGHKGVKDWYAAAEAARPAASAAPAAVTPAVATRAPAAAAPSATTPAAAAPGGGAGLVWANKDSKVYHCQGDRWYGKTKEGAYMSEADAKAHGYRADHGKACQN